MFSSEQWLANSGADFYNGVATTSLRCDPASNPKLVFTPSSASNRKTWTLSFWTKRCGLGGDKIVFNTGVTGTDEIDIFFPSDLFMVSDRSGHQIKTNRLFRDTSSWYHFVIVMDTTQSTNTNRLKLYVNGVQETSFNSPNYPDQNDEFAVNNTKIHHIATRNLGDNDYDGYIAEMNLVDGLALDSSYFGETKNGAWIPKKYTGSYGTNGWRLQFDQTGVGTASTSTIGADTSGNTNHFTSSGIVASDCAMPDSPENNFATWNAVYPSSGTLSEGNLKVLSSGQDSHSTFSVDSGKWYFEYCITNEASPNENEIAWYSESSAVRAGGYLSVSGDKDKDNAVSDYGSTFTTGDIIGTTIDCATKSVNFYKNGVSQGAFTFTAELPVTPYQIRRGGSGTVGGVANFGQDSSFAGTKTAQGNTDGNNIGDFYYAPPSGYLALCTANIPEPTIGPNSDTQAVNHFGVLTYTGDGNQTRTITSGATGITGEIDFQPDWIAHKIRSGTTQGTLNFDSSRGFAGAYGLDWSATTAEGTVVGANSAEYGYISGVGTNSFDVNDGTAVTNGGYVNYSGRTYVAWNWKANGGTTSSNSDGSITSTVQANTDAGFSIVTYTGTGSNATVGHGLYKAPEMVIMKNRAISEHWRVWHMGLSGGTYYVDLNRTNAQNSTGTILTTTPTSSVFAVGTDPSVNGNGNNLISYCFHSVEGYSKFGSYTGNNATDGNMIFTNFSPALVIIKYVSGTAGGTKNWHMYDNKRSAFNPTENVLFANASNAESGASAFDIDFLSNGFKLRNAEGPVNNGAEYIYMCWAETPFKYATAK